MVFIMSDTNNNDSIDLYDESAIVNDAFGNINCVGALEALLFAVGEAVEINKLADSIGVKPKDVENAYEELNKRYDSDDYGIRIIKLDDKLQLCTKNMYYDKLINLVNIPKKYILTDVLLETLSIVAYKQPVTRLEIEQIRGVSCQHAVNKLIEYNLITEVGRLDAPGKPILFGTTDDFLRSFGISSMEDLPVVSSDKIEDFRRQAMEEASLTIET
ncbi:segregation and condensation protein B [Eubacterium ruminantium]|uniref:Segregation and condensation protein B n=2 Tax=Eubacterium ruminantium TaxID=42322 RepID=A0A1T4M0Q0_9FIRM|nr:segregation and condensation protein B [Eubacterium ruminantium]SDM45571.1 segregation and condensation protein B [Eubacterium ruminantium]SJZ60481.1 segregation and condensation protein B [Eubacterium ruminantium]